MEWKYLASPVKKKFKTEPSAAKVLFTVFGINKGQFWSTTKRVAQQ
jgi:hypothetical protein